MSRPCRERDVHSFFGLTYANYLVLHRSILQSMPEDWQEKFVTLLDQLDAAIVRAGIELAPEYDVRCRDTDGRYMRDPVPHYDRGRTLIGGLR